ncbi:MAG: type II secretion system protein [Sulfurimonas sp.]|jgi:prepilin-type N-terminal cleavage/methylation domain-containing protein|nr:type II secretion system protein [Sulfurimonas sp.]
MITKQKFKKAFTMIELVFVIVIMGILAKFGVEFVAQAYSSFINSKINNELQSNSATAVEFVTTRLQNRIKASTIARENDFTFTPLKDYTNTTANILEWVGSDVDGFRGDTIPYWSGVIDLTLTHSTNIYSPATNTGKVDALIDILSDGNSGLNDAAIYFVNPDSLDSNWGWDADTNKFDTQLGVVNNENAIHPINSNGASSFKPVNSASVDNNFSQVAAYEFYQLAWSAYAVGIADWDATTDSGTLTLWYDYQPWKGERYNIHGKSRTIMENVSSFRFIARESLIKVQVCVKSLLIKDEEYSICKEKTIF